MKKFIRGSSLYKMCAYVFFLYFAICYLYFIVWCDEIPWIKKLVFAIRTIQYHTIYLLFLSMKILRKNIQCLIDRIFVLSDLIHHIFLWNLFFFHLKWKIWLFHNILFTYTKIFQEFLIPRKNLSRNYHLTQRYQISPFHILISTLN